MAADVWAWCEKAGTYGRTVTVKAKFADFRQVTRSRSFATVIARHGLPRQASLELVRTLLPTAKGIRLLGVTKFTGTRLGWRRTGPRHTTPSGARPLTRSTARPRRQHQCTIDHDWREGSRHGIEGMPRSDSMLARPGMRSSRPIASASCALQHHRVLRNQRVDLIWRVARLRKDLARVLAQTRSETAAGRHGF